MHARITPEAEFPPMHCTAFCPQHRLKNFAKTQLFLCGWQFLYSLPFFYSNFPHPFPARKIFIRVENFTAAEGTGVPNHCLVVTLQTIPPSTALYLPEKLG